MSAGTSLAPSCFPGMGSMAQDRGVSFRVWAPFAEGVSVAGTFNDWNSADLPMAREEGGYWSCYVPQAQAGQEYKYIIHHHEHALTKNDPYARQLHPTTRNGIILQEGFDWTGDTFRLPDYNQLVIYELHVGTFARGKDGAPGRFDSIIPKLDYLRSLGINVIELMPVADFPSETSWGYNATQPFAVETSYGSPESLKRLVKSAHALGIAIILDVVYNHFGPDDLDLWQFDGWQENGKGGIYFYNDWRAWTPWGENRPDYGRPEVRQYIRDNALFWLEEYHLDGLRLDGVSYIRTLRGSDQDPTRNLPEGWTLLQWINNEIREKFPGRITVAEDLQCNEWLVKDTGAGGAGFSSQWDAAFVHPVRQAVIVAADESRDLEAVRRALTNCYDGDPFKRVVYSESHDEVANGRARVPFEIDSHDAGGFFARKRSTLAAGLVFTAPGIPLLFSGQEMLEDEWFRDNVALDWSKLASFRGINRLYRDLIHLRRNSSGTVAGLTGAHIEVSHVNSEAKVICYRRFLNGGPGDDVIVLANFSNQTFSDYRIGFPREGLWTVRFNSDWEGYGRDYESFPTHDVEAESPGLHGYAFSAPVNIGSYSLVILS